MTISALPLIQGVGTGSPIVYTVPVNTTWVVKKWAFNNTTAGALTITLSINVGTDRELLSVVPIAAKTPYNPTELNGATVTAGGTITITAGVGVTYLHSGIAIV